MIDDCFTNIFKLFFILVNDKLAKRKLTFLPDLFTSILNKSGEKVNFFSAKWIGLVSGLVICFLK